MPPIRGLIENTLIDWEGKLASVVFLPGCNWRCGFCHGRDLVEPGAFNEAIPLDSVRLALRRQRGWLDGVVISGGEPTIHPDLPELCRAFREEEVAVKLDTNGTRPRMLEQVIERKLVDYIAMDVKAPLDERYSEIVRAEADLDSLRRSIQLIMNSGLPYEFRCTVVPTLHDEEEVRAIAEAVAGCRMLYLQSFRPVNCLDRAFESLTPYTPERMRELCRIAAASVQRCAVRGDAGSEIAGAAGAATILAAKTQQPQAQ